MQQLKHKKILLGISGGIAAYKSADLTRRLIEWEAEVRVVMTEGAQAFISPLTFQALSAQPVHTDLLDPSAEAAMGHIELARWADIILIAPASANVIARLAHGFASDLLSTLCLASDARLVIAPAMNRLMWAHRATQDNIATLESRGVHVLGPASGDQACGEVGAGRMLEPLDIRLATAELAETQTSAELQYRRVLITAGPTREAIDPVRFLSNRSSGKMGFAVAEAAVTAGADVTLVTGPVALNTPAGVQRENVISANEMLDAVMTRIETCDIFIAVAAVADYRVDSIADQKIKKNDSTLHLTLERNPDILATVANLDAAPFCVGFAAETQNVENNARAKLEKKRLQMIAANHVAQKANAVFNSDTNALEVFWPGGGHASIASAAKSDVARELISLIAVEYTRANR